jgi:hypothetical protein
LLSSRVLWSCSLVCLLLWITFIPDAVAARRGLRIDFNAWSNAYPITSSDHCPRYDSGSVLTRGDLVFQNPQNPTPYAENMYCQDIPNYSFGMATDEYLNSEVFPDEEAGLAAKVGPNQGSLVDSVTAERYTFLDGDEQVEGATGFQWAFYSFPDGVLIVALYTDLAVQADGFDPVIYHASDEEDIVWEASVNGFDGQYFCFDLGVFIGFWDGEHAGTNPSDGCVMNFVSNRDALVALYNSTTGESWFDDTDWLVGDPCGDGWSRVSCNDTNTEVTFIELGSNNLRGIIPPELGTGNLPELEWLDLSGNKLSGVIPPQIGSLTSLDALYLAGNMLTGSIPTELGNLDNLFFLDLRRNGLYTTDITLDAFLDDHQLGGDWSATQTVAPANPMTISLGATTMDVSWDAIEYTDETGRYRTWYSEIPGGTYTDGGVTENKLETNHRISGLVHNRIYHVIVRAETDSHAGNLNDIVSEDSESVSAVLDLVFSQGFEQE